MFDTVEALETFRSYIKKAETIIITSHKSPDDDSISSLLSVLYWIQKNYPEKSVKAVYESMVHSRWQVFTGYDQIETVDDLTQLKADLLICTDASQYYRCTSKPEVLTKFTTKICIDHHKNKLDDWDWSLVDMEAVSTAEILFQLLYKDADKDLAKLLLFGLLGDTGNLRYIDHTQTINFEIVKRLVEDAQINIQAFKAEYDYFSSDAIEIAKLLFGRQESVKIGEWPTFNLTYLEKNESHYPELDTKEGINMYVSMFGLLQKEMTWSVVLYPGKDGVKLSLRSRPGSVNVRKLVQAMEIGGGHDRAAGGFWEGSDLSVAGQKEKFIAWLKTNQLLFDD